MARNGRGPELAALKLPADTHAATGRMPRGRGHIGGQRSRRSRRSVLLETFRGPNLGSLAFMPSPGNPSGRPLALRSATDATAS